MALNEYEIELYEAMIREKLEPKYDTSYLRSILPKLTVVQASRIFRELEKNPESGASKDIIREYHLEKDEGPIQRTSWWMIVGIVLLVIAVIVVIVVSFVPTKAPCCGARY